MFRSFRRLFVGYTAYGLGVHFSGRVQDLDEDEQAAGGLAPMRQASMTAERNSL